MRVTEAYVALIPLTLPEGVKKSAWVFFPSFRRKPESSIFEPLRTAWTPVFTGVTTKRQFFHIFPLSHEGREKRIIVKGLMRLY